MNAAEIKCNYFINQIFKNILIHYEDASITVQLRSETRFFSWIFHAFTNNNEPSILDHLFVTVVWPIMEIDWSFNSHDFNFKFSIGAWLLYYCHFKETILWIMKSSTMGISNLKCSGHSLATVDTLHLLQAWNWLRITCSHLDPLSESANDREIKSNLCIPSSQRWLIPANGSPLTGPESSNWTNIEAQCCPNLEPSSTSSNHLERLAYKP